jgi:sugar phosphate isomerase/epimerase
VPSLTRRTFLERAACITAIAAVGSRPRAAAPGMFVSLNGALTSGKNVGWPDFARLAARTGYGGVDWSLGPAKTAGADATRALLAELKIRPTIVNLPLTGPFAGDNDAFRQKLPPLADDAAFTASIGCQKMMLVLPAASAGPKDEYRALVRERLAAVSEVLQRSNIRLGLEFLGPLYMRAGGAGARAGATPGPPRVPFIWTLNETVALANDCGPNIGAVLDAWHWHHSGSTVNDILAAGKQRIIHVHVSDAKPAPPEDVRDNQRFMPGEGAIDLVGFFQALQKIGYDDGVSPEPLGRVTAEMTADESAKLGFDTTVAVMKKAGVL